MFGCCLFWVGLCGPGCGCGGLVGCVFAWWCKGFVVVLGWLFVWSFPLPVVWGFVLGFVLRRLLISTPVFGAPFALALSKGYWATFSRRSLARFIALLWAFLATLVKRVARLSLLWYYSPVAE